jgi:hypothetical protein
MTKKVLTMSNLIPTPITDKNGKQTTVLKKADSSAAGARSVPSPLNAADAESSAKVRALLTNGNTSLAKPENAKLLDSSVRLIVSTPAVLDVDETVEATFRQANGLGYTKQSWTWVVNRAKEGHTEFLPTDGVNYLELDDEDESLPWADRYKIKLANMVAEKGKPKLPGDSIYGWVDNDMSKHLNRCYIAEVTSVKEDEWSEFADTFAGNNDYQGVQCDAQCGCGRFRGQLRSEGTIGDFIEDMNSRIEYTEIFD